MTSALKLGTAQYTYLWDRTLDETLQEIKTLGFKYIELMTTFPHIWPPAFSQSQRDDLRKQIDRLGLELVAINPTFLDINLASTNPGFRKESVQQIMDQITLAHDLGAKIIVVIVGKRHPLLAPPFEDVWEKYAKAGVLKCVEHAEKNNVIFGLENGPSLFVDNTDKMLFVLNEVCSSSMKIVFDVANASMVEPVDSAFEKIKDHLAHVHLSDTDFNTWTHSPVGTGKIDFAGVAKKLREIDYSGISILETTDSEDPKGGIMRSVEKLLPMGWQI
jgi:sugar phosphate isomerase/epimerase